MGNASNAQQGNCVKCYQLMQKFLAEKLPMMMWITEKKTEKVAMQTFLYNLQFRH